jgi:hypothetical protein
MITGLVTDDSPVSGLTVYFSSDQGHHFTTQVNVLGLFSSLTISMAYGTQVSIYTIDSAGNHSNTLLLIV